MSCATNPIDKHDDNVILQSLIKIADIGKIMSYDLDSSRTVDCIELPDTICLWQDGRITQLNLYNMGLSGPIPENIGNLDKLVTLGLSSNELIGGIPESIGNLSELTQLSLDSNHLSGNIPESIGNIKKLNWLRLVNNQFSGSIPDTIGSLPALRGLLINGNQFNLEITNNICNIYNNLDTINVTGNQFCPPFPSCIDYPNIIGKQDCQGLECKEGLTEINHYCYLDSDMNVLQSLIDNSPSDSLNMIMDVDTSGTIEPLELGKQEWHSGKLETLDCYWGNVDSTSCNLSQSIPEFISDLEDLTTLDLQQNNISGNLPEKLGDMDKLTSLNLSSNQLIDYIPEEICKIYTADNDINLGNNLLCPCYPQCITELVNAFATTQETSECAYCDEGYTQFCDNVPYRDNLFLYGFDFSEPESKPEKP